MTTMRLSPVPTKRMVVVTLALMATMCIVLPLGSVFAQNDSPDGTYRLKLTVGAGGSLSTTPAGIPSGMTAEASKFGPAATVRLMWCPDHLLSMGIESGWTKIYSYETSGADAGKVFLSQVPSYFVFSMKPLENFNILGGYGYSRLNTSLEYGGTVNISQWSMGWIAAASYEKPIAQNLALAGELKWINAIEEKQGTITLQVQLVWDFFQW
jgi:hypothetical protein